MEKGIEINAIADTLLYGSAPSPEHLASLHGTVLLAFGTNECRHCIAAEPLITAALVAYPNIQRIEVEDGPGRPLGRSFKVKLWPSLILVRQGEEIARLVRPTESAAIDEFLAKAPDDGR